MSAATNVLGQAAAQILRETQAVSYSEGIEHFVIVGSSADIDTISSQCRP